VDVSLGVVGVLAGQHDSTLCWLFSVGLLECACVDCCLFLGCGVVCWLFLFGGGCFLLLGFVVCCASRGLHQLTKVIVRLCCGGLVYRLVCGLGGCVGGGGVWCLVGLCCVLVRVFV